MANVTRFDPFNDLVDDLFKGFLVRPLAYENGRTEALPRMKVDVVEKNGAFLSRGEAGCFGRFTRAPSPCRCGG